MSYYYYSKIDSSKEKLGRIEAYSKTEAIEKLAEVKKLNIDSLLKLWGVEKINNESKKRF